MDACWKDFHNYWSHGPHPSTHRPTTASSIFVTLATRVCCHRVGIPPCYFNVFVSFFRLPNTLTRPGWVHLQVIANFNKMKKISKDVRAIASALESSEALVLEKKGGKYRVRRKVRKRARSTLRYVSLCLYILFFTVTSLSLFHCFRTWLLIFLAVDAWVDAAITRFLTPCVFKQECLLFRLSRLFLGVAVLSTPPL